MGPDLMTGCWAYFSWSQPQLQNLVKNINDSISQIQYIFKPHTDTCFYVSQTWFSIWKYTTLISFVMLILICQLTIYIPGTFNKHCLEWKCYSKCSGNVQRSLIHKEETVVNQFFQWIIENIIIGKMRLYRVDGDLIHCD